MTTLAELHYPCGTIIAAGTAVEFMETFRVNRGEELRVRFAWGGRLWQCEKNDLCN